MTLFAWDLKIDVAIIAATASVGAALVSAIVSLATTRSARIAAERLEEQKGRLSKELASESSRLAEISAERSARRDYEYDARKRLYSEIEPLLFQLYEALEEAHYRVRSLARTSRDNHLPGWLDSNGYYLNSTAFKLIIPAVLLRIMQRQMTFVDLRLDETIRIRYQLLKLYSRSFTDDFLFAAVPAKLAYDPNNPQWRQLKSQDPAKYTRQGLLVGDLENICDALIVEDANHRARAIGFSEFERLLLNLGKRDSILEMLSLLASFSPSGRPVLARILVAQAVMAQLILSTYAQDISVEELPERLRLIACSGTAGQALTWQNGVDCADIPIALEYWRERLRWLHGRESFIEADR